MSEEQDDAVFEAGFANVVEGLHDHFYYERSQIHSFCQGPIEKRFADAMLTTHLSNIHRPWCLRPDNVDWLDHLSGLQISPQRRVGSYRVDFALRFREWGISSQVAVECDGHDFHEKTKEQAARDKARDRYLIAQGLTPMRFTGSEIFRDPHACASQVADHLWEEWARLNQIAEAGKPRS